MNRAFSSWRATICDGEWRFAHCPSSKRAYRRRRVTQMTVTGHIPWTLAASTRRPRPRQVVAEGRMVEPCLSGCHIHPLDIGRVSSMDRDSWTFSTAPTCNSLSPFPSFSGFFQMTRPVRLPGKVSLGRWVRRPALRRRGRTLTDTSPLALTSTKSVVARPALSNAPSARMPNMELRCCRVLTNDRADPSAAATQQDRTLPRAIRRSSRPRLCTT